MRGQVGYAQRIPYFGRNLSNRGVISLKPTLQSAYSWGEKSQNTLVWGSRGEASLSESNRTHPIYPLRVKERGVVPRGTDCHRDIVNTQQAGGGGNEG